MSKKTIAIVGNPNCGKTTLFNALTGGKVKTGNWPGVTVEKREGVLKLQNEEITVVDLPGIYSFSAHSEDEKVARDYILSDAPSLIVNILDSTNLERNLYLTTQLIEMKVPILVVLNMMDLAEKQKLKIAEAKLSKMLDLPVMGISAVRKGDVSELKDIIAKSTNDPKISGVEIQYPNEMEEIISQWSSLSSPLARELSIDSRWISLKLLEGDAWVKGRAVKSGILTDEEIQKKQDELENLLQDSPDILAADYRYGLIHSISKSVVKKSQSRQTLTEKADRIILNRWLGIPIFLGIMYLLFWVTISIGGAFIDFFDIFFGTIFVDGFGSLLESFGTPVWLKVILADGIGGGIQTIATFVPIIFMMFLMLSLLEDSGYMARAAFVMDRFMKLIGLPGKSFVPMLVGFGCTVPAIMATRTLESKKDRFLTIFMSPFMSCGARLPVYALFGAAFFPKNAGLMVFSLYFAGIILAILTGLLLKNTVFKGEPSYFVMELPPYHSPRFRHIMIHTWDRLKGFIIRAGKVIILVVAILSVLNSLGTDGTIGNEDSETSVLAAVGKAITPIFEPMGVEEENWPATVGIFTGIFAKEAVVGTLNSLYSQIDAVEAEEEEGEEEAFDFWAGIGEAFVSIPEGLAGIFGGLADPLGVGLLSEDEETIAEDIGADQVLFGRMRDFFTQGSNQAYAYLLFILIYLPCVAALGAVIKETGTFIGIINALYLTLLAWVVSVLYYQLTTGHQFLWIAVAVLLAAVMVLAFWLLRNSKGFKTAEE